MPKENSKAKVKGNHKQENNEQKSNLQKDSTYTKNSIEIGDTIVLSNNNENVTETIEEANINKGLNNVNEYTGDKDLITEENSETGIELAKSRNISINKKDKKKWIIIGVVAFAFIAAIVGFCLVNKMNSNIYKNVFLGDTLVSNMDVNKLDSYIVELENQMEDISINILQGDNAILKVVPQDIDFKINTEDTKKQVLEFGRNSNIAKNNWDILVALIAKKRYEVVYDYDVNKLSDIVKEIKESLDGKTIDDSYIVDTVNNKLIISRGTTGISVDESNLKEDIIKLLASREDNEYTIKTKTTRPIKLDVDVVYSQIYKEPKDARIDKKGEKIKLVAHEVGYSFDKEDLRSILDKEENQEEGKVIEYTLVVTNPKVMTKDIAWDMYEYQISSYTTNFPTTDYNRVNNLKIALEKLNGTVIMPEETFSYNAIVGSATAAQGFLPAATFVGGRVIKEVGGGICQTVSTLYNTALLANMEIVQRKAHSLPVGYVPPSRDATVYYPSIDFKFKNTREYPIKIITHFNAAGSLNISLYGTKEDKEYEVTITSKVLSYSNFSTSYVQDASMYEGESNTTQLGSKGYTSQAYIVKKLDGKVVESKTLSTDTYKSVDQIVNVGTKKAAIKEPTPEPIPAPEVQTPPQNTEQPPNPSTGE